MTTARERAAQRAREAALLKQRAPHVPRANGTARPRATADRSIRLAQASALRDALGTDTVEAVGPLAEARYGRGLWQLTQREADEWLAELAQQRDLITSEVVE